MSPESIAAARVVINEVLGVQRSESVLITNDSRRTDDVSSLLASAAWEAGATPVELFMPKLARPGMPIPSLVAQAARHADVWVELNEIYILGTVDDHAARQAGLRRFYSLSGMTTDDLILLELNVDRASLTELGERLAVLTTGREEIRITCENGSDFRGSIRGCVATPDTTTMPLGQTHISPRRRVRDRPSGIRRNGLPARVHRDNHRADYRRVLRGPISGGLRRAPSRGSV